MKIRPVILCGGAGTRLWPLSRSLYPKQFIDFGGHTLFGNTLRRAMSLPDTDSLFVVCNEEQRFLAAAQLQERNGQGRVILEPVGRNTAPAIAVAALAARDEDDVFLLVLPSDHVLRDVEAFAAAVADACVCAANGRLVAFGITPEWAESGYGWLQRGDALATGFSVRRFVEKPCGEDARAMFAEGGYYWNSGMFLFKPSQYLDELQKFAPDIYARSCAAWEGRVEDTDFTRLEAGAFAACPSDSIDYAVMEKTPLAAMVTLAAGWSDVGSWAAVYDAEDKDANGNVCVGDVVTVEASGNYLHSNRRLVAALGIDNTVVVETGDAVLVADKSRSQDVKKLVARLAESGRVEKDAHIRVLRPWGWYETLSAGDRFQVKRIMVNSGASLSLQLHHHRAEHWVVVCGTGEITVDGDVTLLHEDQSTYIPLGARHRLTNPGRLPLEIIEVQSGAYLGEDDIVRFDDHYGRQ